jgi:hypothetical protein
MNRTQLGALVAGALTFLLSLFPSYITVSFDGDEAMGIGSISDGTNAWESYATLGMLLVIVATGLVAVKLFAPQVLPATIPWNLVTAAAAGLGALLLILRALTASESVMGVSVGPGWSGWLIFVTSIALTVFAVLGFRESGEKLPGNGDAGASTTES